VLEPYYRSMETASRVSALAAELGIADVVVLSNKVRDEADRAAITGFCAAHGLAHVGEIPFDPTLAETERHGLAPVDQASPGPAVQALRRLALTLTE